MILVSFDLSFFTSIPGMLITGGVLLLLIALIIFIATGQKKEKKEEDNSSIVENTPSVDVNVTPSDAVTQMNEMAEAKNSVDQQPVVENVSFPTDIAFDTPVVEEANVAVEPVAVQNVSVNPVIDNEATSVSLEPINVVDEVQPVEVKPVLENDVNNIEIPTVEPVVESVVETTATEIPVQNITPVVEDVPVVTVNEEIPQVTPVVNENEYTAKPIYGGTSPIVPNIEVNDIPRQIYGGANPLENTQSVPIVKEETPKVEPVFETTQVEVPNESQIVVETPVVESQGVKVEPVVEEVKPIVNNQPEEIESLF